MNFEVALSFFSTCSESLQACANAALANSWSIAYTVLALAAALVYYRVFWRPLNYSYDDVLNEHKDIRSSSRTMAAVMRARKTGDLPPPFPNGWFHLFDSAEIRKGEVKYINCLGLNLAVFRGMSGVVSAIDAYCPHLGANIGLEGKVVNNSLECPFHGWRFEGNGQCSHIPYAEKVPEHTKTNSYRVMETHGQILIWHDAENREPLWLPGLPEVDEQGYKLHGISHHIVSAHCQEIPENGADVAHLNVLHSPFFVQLFNGWLEHKWEASWTPLEAPFEHVANMKLKQWAEFTFMKCKVPLTEVDVDIRQTGPGLVYLRFNLPFGKVVVVEAVTPVAPLLCKTSHVVWASPLVPRFLAKFVLRALLVQFERDLPIWRSKKFLRKPMIVKEDGKISAFRRWFSKHYSEHSMTTSEFHAQSTEW
eukprot:GILI01010561.1.p2 GENE.GILI01010561.1~~GILI01010561.1.p2  ORF type:complete len:422 (+),score=99.71 GILI01010561.1:115-1380(+)